MNDRLLELTLEGSGISEGKGGREEHEHRHDGGLTHGEGYTFPGTFPMCGGSGWPGEASHRGP